MNTLDDSVIKALMQYPSLSSNFDAFSRTGMETYAEMIELDLNVIQQQYGQAVYNRLNKQYLTIKEVLKQ